MKYCLILLLLLCGCSTTNLAKVIAAAAKDPAMVDIQVSTPWGTLVYHRNNNAATNLTIFPVMIQTNSTPFIGVPLK